MEAHVEIGNKKLSSIREASKQVSYSRDYITRLAREGKVTASQIGRQWYVEIKSLKNYAEVSALEAEIRKTHLSEKRKQEKLFRSANEQHEAAQRSTEAAAHKIAVATSGSVLAVGLLAGVFGYSLLLAPANFDTVARQGSATNQYSQTAANAKAVMTTGTSDADKPSVVDRPISHPIETTESIPTGILMLPVGDTTDPAAIFSDAVRIETATSGRQTAVLLDRDGAALGQEVPFVLVPVKTDQI